MVTIEPTAGVPMNGDEQQRCRALERDLGRLEGIVEALTKSIMLESEMAQKARLETRQEMSELGGRMERAVEGLAEEVKKLVRESAKQEAQLTAHRAQQDGALGASRWVIATAIATGALAASWFGSKTGSADIQKALDQYRAAEGKPVYRQWRPPAAHPDQ